MRGERTDERRKEGWMREWVGEKGTNNCGHCKSFLRIPVRLLEDKSSR